MRVPGTVAIDRAGIITAHALDPLSAPDRAFLERYLGEVKRLTDVSNQIPKTSLNLNFSFGHGKDGARTEWVGLSDELYAALVLRIRPFILANEPYFFFKVGKLLVNYMPQDDLRLMLGEMSNHFKGLNVLKTLDVRGAEPRAHSDAILFDYLNAKDYHRDQDKIEKLYDGGDLMYAIREYSAFEALHHKLESITIQASLATAMVEGTPFTFRLALPKAGA